MSLSGKETTMLIVGVIMCIWAFWQTFLLKPLREIIKKHSEDIDSLKTKTTQLEAAGDSIAKRLEDGNNLFEELRKTIGGLMTDMGVLKEKTSWIQSFLQRNGGNR